MSQYSTYEEILDESKSAHVTADVLDILVLRTKELTSEKQREIEKLESLLQSLEQKLSENT